MRIDKNKVSLWRARRCLSISDLRSRGLSQGNLNSIWNGRSVKPETAGKIAKALEVDVTEILADK